MVLDDQDLPADEPGEGRQQPRRSGDRLSGSENEKVLPLPTSLSSSSFPFIRDTSWRLIVRPSPVPPKRRVVEPSAWRKASKMRARLSLGTPTPVSSTPKQSRGPASCWAIVTATATCPVLVNFTALPIKLVRTWRMRTGSPNTRAGTSIAMRTNSSMALACDWVLALCRLLCKTIFDRQLYLLDVELAGFDLGEVEDVVDDLEQAFGRGVRRT